MLVTITVYLLVGVDYGQAEYWRGNYIDLFVAGTLVTVKRVLFETVLGPLARFPYSQGIAAIGLAGVVVLVMALALGPDTGRK